MVWGGATFDAIARLKQLRPSMQSHRSSIRPHELAKGPAKESFDCMFLCGACGYLSDTDPPCPACGRKLWIDLDYWALAEALRAHEEEARRHPPERLKWQIRVASLVGGATLGAGCAAWLALAGIATLGWPALVALGGGTAALTHRLGRRRIGRAIMARRVERPSRWRIPLPLVSEDAEESARVVGPAQPRGPLLTAPFSGRPCLAYELGVLFDAPGDAWPPVWVLREMRSCAFDVADRRVEADGVTLALPIAPVAEPAITETQRQRFLRQRGLFLVDGRFDLFEAIVEPGAHCELSWASSPADAPPLLLGVRRGASPAPSR